MFYERTIHHIVKFGVSCAPIGRKYRMVQAGCVSIDNKAVQSASVLSLTFRAALH